MAKIYPIGRAQGNDIIDKLEDIANVLNNIETNGIIGLINNNKFVYQLTSQDQQNIAAIMNIPNATLTTAGIVKPDGETITIDENGILRLAAIDADNISY